MVTKEDIMARREELMARADELRERFADNVDEEVVAQAAGWTLVSAGIAVGVTMWFRGRRTVLAMLLPIGLITGGAMLLGNTAWHRRGSRILEAEARVREELASLDPVARLQVMREVGPETMPFVRRHAHN